MSKKVILAIMVHKSLSKLLMLPFMVILIAITTNCKGPAGPAGADGTPGVDGNAVCIDCHNLTVKNDITAEYMLSGHYEGANVSYAGGRNGCAMCHSEQGFIETQYTGLDTTAANIPLPQAIGCKTCHSFHASFDFENETDYALRTTKPVELLMYRAADPNAPPVTIDLGPSSNLCAVCHQPRRLGPDLTADSAYVSSSHYGPHHGPHSTTVAGIGAAELNKGFTYPSPGTGSKHVTDADCVSCHMHEGEHTWEPSLDGCNTAACHNGSITSVDQNNRQLNFATKLDQLKTKLTTAGLLDADGHPVKGTFTSEQVAALYNYEWIVDDRSMGIHNFPYLEALLDNSLAAF